MLASSLIAAALAAVVLRRRNQVYRQIHLKEERDNDDDGIRTRFGRTLSKVVGPHHRR